VHRIDKDTSGVLVAAKNDMAHRNLAKQIKEHTVNRRYIALVEGIIKTEHGTVEGAIGRNPTDRKKMDIVQNGKPAITHFKVLRRFKNYTLIEAKLETGRTHQIRVHMSHIGHPVVGDPLYGVKKQKFNLKGQALHAAVLGFMHPRTGDYMEFRAPLPDYFKKLISVLDADNQN
jgi:23S rRNA pseudouridine1911/1915/1917 synthase